MQQPELDPALLRNRVMTGQGTGLLTPAEVAAVLGISGPQLDLLLTNGVFTPSILSGEWGLIRASEVKAYLNRRGGHGH